MLLWGGIRGAQQLPRHDTPAPSPLICSGKGMFGFLTLWNLHSGQTSLMIMVCCEPPSLEEDACVGQHARRNLLMSIPELSRPGVVYGGRLQ